MKLINVLMSNGYFALKDNESELFEKLAPSKIIERYTLISDSDYQLLKEKIVVEGNEFNEIELIPNGVRTDTYIKHELELV